MCGLSSKRIWNKTQAISNSGKLKKKKKKKYVRKQTFFRRLEMVKELRRYTRKIFLLVKFKQDLIG